MPFRLTGVFLATVRKKIHPFGGLQHARGAEDVEKQAQFKSFEPTAGFKCDEMKVNEAKNLAERLHSRKFCRKLSNRFGPGLHSRLTRGTRQS
jgi:hypothetical protein